MIGWEEFEQRPWTNVAKVMKRRTLLDARNLLDRSLIRRGRIDLLGHRERARLPFPRIRPMQVTSMTSVRRSPDQQNGKPRFESAATAVSLVGTLPPVKGICLCTSQLLLALADHASLSVTLSFLGSVSACHARPNGSYLSPGTSASRAKYLIGLTLPVCQPGRYRLKTDWARIVSRVRLATG